MIDVETERTLCALAVAWFFGSLFLGAVFAAAVNAVRAKSYGATRDV